MKFKSLRDILSFAMAKEQSSVQFYKRLADRVQKQEATAVFENLANQEEEHIEAIKLEMLKLGYTVPEASSSDDVAEVSLEMDEQAEEMGYFDALRLAIQKERAAFKLYAQLLAMAEEPDAQKMFIELAEEEMRHVLQLEREISAMSYGNKG